MNIKNISANYLFLIMGLFFSILSSQDINKEMDLRKELEKKQSIYILDFLRDNEKKLIGQVKEDMNLNKGRKKKPYIEIFLKIWEVKAYFLNGDIEEAKKVYRDIKELTIVNDSLWSNLLFHEPFSYEMRECNQKKCICKKIDHKSNNLDFLDSYEFNQHFKDLSIEFGDENSKEIPVIKRSIVKGKKNNKGKREKIEILIDPPNAKFRNIEYSSDASSEDILDYYFNKAKKRRMDQLEDAYKERKESYELKFEDSYNLQEEQWSKVIRYLPTTSEHLEDVNRTFYKFYIRDGKDIKRRYSKALIQEDIEEEEEEEYSQLRDEESLLIDWDPDWEMQELKDEGKLLFLFPEAYIIPGYESAFKIGKKTLAKKDELGKNIIISDTYNEELLEKYGISNGINMKVYEVEIIFDKDTPVKLEFTKDYSLFKEEEEKINQAMKWLYISFSVCLGVLLLL